MNATKETVHTEVTEDVMTPEDEANLAYYLSFDSADMPSSMAVNQDQLAAEKSIEVAPVELRSKFYGVYSNTNEATKQTVPFRAAIKLNGRGKPFWMNLGYFDCEHVAALAYNTAAVNYFGEKAWLNPVDHTMCKQDTLNDWKMKQAKHITTAQEKAREVHKAGKSFNMVDLESDQRV